MNLADDIFSSEISNLIISNDKVANYFCIWCCLWHELCFIAQILKSIAKVCSYVAGLFNYIQFIFIIVMNMACECIDITLHVCFDNVIVYETLVFNITPPPLIVIRWVILWWVIGHTNAFRFNSGFVYYAIQKPELRFDGWYRHKDEICDCPRCIW